MLKFKVHVFTPYEEFDRTYFAKTKERAEAVSILKKCLQANLD